MNKTTFYDLSSEEQPQRVHVIENLVIFEQGILDGKKRVASTPNGSQWFLLEDGAWQEISDPSKRHTYKSDASRLQKNLQPIENPKQNIGASKPLTSVLPWPVIFEVEQRMQKDGCAILTNIHPPTLYEVSLGITEGAWKYGRHNYRVAENILASTYFDATNRHLDAFLMGTNIDQESGLHHGVKAICSLLVLCDSIMQGTFQDNRPPESPFDFGAVPHCSADDYLTDFVGRAKLGLVAWWEGGDYNYLLDALVALFELSEVRLEGDLDDDRQWNDSSFLQRAQKKFDELNEKIPFAQRLPEWTYKRFLAEVPGADQHLDQLCYTE